MNDFFAAFSGALAYTMDDRGFKKVMMTCMLFVCAFLVYSHVQREQAASDIQTLQMRVERLETTTVTQREMHLIQSSILGQNLEIQTRLQRIEQLMMSNYDSEG